ncbi:MAG: hypothetical protein J5506_03075 [Prevotella sp.]|nr:hypothetical protein [Prevotella sp.]
MRKDRIWILAVVMTLCGTLSSNAQTNLTGRVYSNANIMAGVMRDIDKELADVKTKAVAKAEKEKGRKLTANELKDVDKIVKDGETKLKAIKDGMKIGITVEFKSPTDVVYKSKTSISDAALKAAGVPWLKRKAMKAAMAIAPESEKSKYQVKGNLVIMGDAKEGYDTLHISADGKQIYGVFERDKKEKKKPIKFTLTRTK